MFKQRSQQKELMDDYSLSGEELALNLRELELTNRLFGSQAALLNSLEKVRQYYPKHKNLSIVDVGCGNGGLLRALSKWAQAKGLMLNLLGIDINPFMIEQAKAQSKAFSDIQYQVMDLFSSEFLKLSFDIISLNSFCHHISDAELIKILAQLRKQARLAIVINDLQRHAISYYSIKFLAKLFRFSKLSQNDGPLSVLRAFHKREIIDILKKSYINRYSISWRFAFRWQVIIWQKE
ncbi:MAG: SAM-dependent methyltransferase [Gammaproteobacteria bacterium]|jgi:2-polyprenyl-3-methyl-5-hydroxy-6-metoxy-1,4-benzoquinol methylase|nr:SAM-dependent methyltransferase [Gammaproteobacteria bacterium]